MTTRLILVGGNKGGTGKTTVGRLLLEYVDTSSWRVFDGQAPGGSLKRFRRDAEVVAFGTTGGRMRVLDALAERTTFIDLPADLLSETLQMLRDAGFLDDVANQRVKLTVVHVLGPNVESLREAADVAGRLADGGDHIVVRNAANDERFEYGEAPYTQMIGVVAPAATFDLPHMDAVARSAVDQEGGTFGEFCKNTKSDYLRRVTMRWTFDCFHAMSEAELSSFL